MNFEFSEEQNMLRDSLARLLSDTYDFDARKKIIESDEGWSRDIWKTLAELGVFAAAFPEEYDGFGGTASDSLVIMEELGRVLLVEPFLPTVILCGQILRAIGGDHAQALIPQIISGDAILGLAMPSQSLVRFYHLLKQAPYKMVKIIFSTVTRLLSWRHRLQIN